jgi:O-antigen/teichoic acid export membrane protein
MLKKALMLVSGNAFASALLLIRNLIVARMLSPEDYGIASTFAIVMSIVEMLSYLGLQQMIVVDKDGDDPHVQAAMQGFQAMRGTFSAIVMFFVARPYAAFLGIEHVAWAYELLAMVPLINGLQHFDQHRLKRHLNFTPSIVSSTVPALVATVALWPIAAFFDDYRVMLASLLVQAVAMVLLSHLTAERRYRIAYDAAIIRRSIVFGWPLLLNGILLFGIFNGEKLIVGRELGMAALAIFAMGFTLTLTPTLVMANSLQSFFLPQLSAARDRDAEFQLLGRAAVESGLVVGVVLVMGTALVGGPVVGYLLGPKYFDILPIMLPLAVMQAVRVAKTGSSIIALAKGQSGNATWANMFRILALPVAWIIAIRTGDIIAIIWVAVAAEAAGFLFALYLVRRRAGLHVRWLVLPIILSVLVCVVSTTVITLEPEAPTFGQHLSALHLTVIVVGFAALAGMTALRGIVLRRFRRRNGA